MGTYDAHTNGDHGYTHNLCGTFRIDFFVCVFFCASCNTLYNFDKLFVVSTYCQIV